MDKEWVRDKLLRAGTEVTDESNDECDAVWLTIPRPSVDGLADTIVKGTKKDLVWEGDGWIFFDGAFANFEPADTYIGDSDLLIPIEDGDAIHIVVTKLEDEKSEVMEGTDGPETG